MKKLPGDIIILHRCNLNDNHMHGSWDIERDRQNFLSFCPLPLTTWTINILKNEKNIWRYHHFTHLYHKWQSYEVWFLSYQAWQTRIFCHFGLFFALTTQKIKILKNWQKKSLEKLSFYTSVPKIMIICYTVP